jgi:hypothetical protein
LKKYKAGGVSWEVAATIVGEAKPLADSLLSRFRQENGGRQPLSLKQHYELFLKKQGRRVEMPAFSQTHASLLEDYDKLNQLLDQHFFIKDTT